MGCRVQRGPVTEKHPCGGGRGAGDKNGETPAAQEKMSSAAAEELARGGLVNPSGSNLCFLNVAMQLLWHTDSFRNGLLDIQEYAKYGQWNLVQPLLETFFEMATGSHGDSERVRLVLGLVFPEKFMQSALSKRDRPGSASGICAGLATSCADEISGCCEIHTFYRHGLLFLGSG